MKLPGRTVATGVALPCAAFLAATTLFAQAPPLSFEVATVKVASPSARTGGLLAVDTDPAMVRYSNITLRNLIALAYGFDSRLILGGPAWLDSGLYEVAAKPPRGAPKDRIPLMLQTLLADRFKLAVHRESREQRVYFLVVAKNGPRAQEASATDSQEGEHFRGDHVQVQILPGAIRSHAVAMAGLAAVLAQATGLQVVDHTNLAGTFDVDLRWTPENTDGNGPDLFTAIQEQLGLKLQPGKAAVEMLRIDHVDRIPTDN